MNKHPASKGPPNLVFSKPNKKPYKYLKQPLHNQKLSVKTSLDQRLKSTDQFLKPQKYVKGLAKSAQQLSQKNLFKNSQIKKSIELLKTNTGRLVEKSNQYERQLTSEQKYNRDAYYGNTTTSQTKSNQKSSRSKLSERSKQSSPQIFVKPLKPNTKKQSSVCPALRQPLSLARRKQPQLGNKQHKRLKKLQQQYVRLLEDKLEQKQAELNTLRTRNMLQQMPGFSGQVEELREGEMRRLKKIHRTEEEMCERRIELIRRQIMSLCEKEANDVMYFGGCEDVLSFIQGKD